MTVWQTVFVSFEWQVIKKSNKLRTLKNDKVRLSWIIKIILYVDFIQKEIKHAVKGEMRTFVEIHLRQRTLPSLYARLKDLALKPRIFLRVVRSNFPLTTSATLKIALFSLKKFV